MHSMLRIWIFLLAMLAGVTGFHGQAQAAGKNLFSATIAAKAADSVVHDDTIMRHRDVNINPGIVSQGDGTGGSFVFNLFDDASFTATIDNITKNPSGSISYSGKLPGIEFGTWTMVQSDSGVFANIHAVHQGDYQVRFDGGGNHAVMQMDPSKFKHHHLVPIPDKPLAPRNPPAGGDSSSVVDVMVVYTASARSGAGSTAAIESTVDLAVTETNTALSNSNISTRIRLVYKGEISYTESGTSSTDLSRLRNTSDGFMDDVHTLRNTYGADLVALITESMTDACGIGYLMDSVSSSFDVWAFSVSRRSCATGSGYTFGHELGHNWGLGHDLYADSQSSTALTPYAYYARGYVNKTERWKTIMAYDDECTASGVSCSTIQYFSSPNVSHPTTGTALGNTTSSDSRRAMNENALTIANFRQAVTQTSSTGLMSLTQVQRRPASQKVVSPYWEAQSGIYTLIAVTHPSLSGMNSQIGVQVDAVLSDATSGGAVTFTISSKATQRVFIVTTNASHSIRSGTPSDGKIITLDGSGAQRGSVIASPVATTPSQCEVNIANHCGFRDITSLSYWGAVVVSGTATGFAMEFVGDLHDSIDTGSNIVQGAGLGGFVQGGVGVN